MKSTVLAFAALTAAGVSARPFETIALVDSLDFATYYDIETDQGNLQVLDHVMRNHCTDIWWRDKSGGKMRYPSVVEGWPITETPFVKTRLPCEDAWGYLRLDAPRANPFPLISDECRRRGLKFGIHTTTEENHWCSQLCSNWTLEHPQYWTCTLSGVPFMGISSYAYPEVIDHKLAMLDERLKLGGTTIFLDTWRNGDWSANREYVKPNLDEWERRYRCAPPTDSNDPRWIEIVERHVEDYIRRFSAKCRAANVRFVIGVHFIDGKGDLRGRSRAGFDWRKLAAEGVFDGVAPLSVVWSDKDPFGETLRLYRYVREVCGAKADAYFPVSAYDFYRYGIPSYAKATKLSKADVVRRLMDLAWEAGGRGVTFECVDYGNYSDAECRAIAEMLEKFKTVPSGGRGSAQP